MFHIHLYDRELHFSDGLIARLNPQGSHPGLSDQEDCTFRLHIVIITARLVLRRLAHWGQ